MKKDLRILIIMVILLLMTACTEHVGDTHISSTPPGSTSSAPTVSVPKPTESVPTDPCSKGHSFPNDANVCSVCGVDYFAATLKFALGDTKDYYIVSRLGSCTRRKIVIPETYDGLPVTQIGDNAFSLYFNEENGVSYCSEIEEVVLPSSITRIGECAFEYCVQLKKISLPEGVTELGAGAFNGCLALTELVIPDSVVSVGAVLFAYCESLESICLPGGISEIPDCFAMQCLKLKTVVCKGNIQHIGKEAFLACKSLESIEWGDDLQGIGECSFCGCESLTAFDLGNQIETIPRGAFAECSDLESLILPETVKAIGDQAFWGCTSLRQISIPETLESFGSEVFINCDSLDFAVYEGMGYVGNNANPHLILVRRLDQSEKNVVMHDDTRFLGSYAFYESDIESLYFGKNYEHKGFRSVYGIDTLAKIDVAPGNRKYHAAGNCLIETESKTLELGCYTSVIPDDGSVTDIGKYAFGRLDSLTAIVVPDSITCIQWYAFTGCTNLKVLVIGSGVKKIEAHILSEPKYPGAMDVFYKGSEADWKNVVISGRDYFGIFEGNPVLLNEVNFYYYSETQPTEPGNFWHYVDGKPTPWESEE